MKYYVCITDGFCEKSLFGRHYLREDDAIKFAEEHDWEYDQLSDGRTYDIVLRPVQF